MEKYRKYEEYIRSNLCLALGCTEPASIALAAITAYERIKGEVKSINIDLGINVYKNALYVGIPGVKQKGIDIAILLGIYSGNSSDKLEVFNNVTQKDINRAIDNREKVHVNVINQIETVMIDIVVHTDKGKARCRIENEHTNVVLIEVNDSIQYKSDNLYLKEDDIQDIDYEDFIQNIQNIPVERFNYVMEGVEKLNEITEVGLSNDVPLGIGKAIKSYINRGMIADDIINNTAFKISAAAEARLSGAKVSVMSCGGSGSQGIATILPIIEMAHKMHIAKNRMVKAIVVGYATTLYTKKALGKLSSICGCAIASSIGSTVGIVWMQGGSKEDIKGAINNVVGSLTGVICDGAKVGCAFKMSMGAIMSIYSALLAVDNVVIGVDNGIIGNSITQTIKNLSIISNEGMQNMNNVIVNIMSNKSVSDI